MKMKSTLVVASFWLALVGPGVARADSIFDITAAFTDGTTLSGTFAIDTTGLVTSVDMMLAGVDASGPYTQIGTQGPYTSLKPSFYTLSVFDSLNNFINLSFPQVSLVGYAGGELCGINSGSCLVTAPISGKLESDFFIQGGPTNPTSTLDTGLASPVPEPSSLLLLGTGLIGGIGVMRRRVANIFRLK
jgi:hypothetical protein